jgi:hypothetical protein
MNHLVSVCPEAQQQLASLYRDIAEHASPTIAERPSGRRVACFQSSGAEAATGAEG